MTTLDSWSFVNPGQEGRAHGDAQSVSSPPLLFPHLPPFFFLAIRSLYLGKTIPDFFCRFLSIRFLLILYFEGLEDVSTSIAGHTRSALVDPDDLGAVNHMECRSPFSSPFLLLSWSFDVPSSASSVDNAQSAIVDLRQRAVRYAPHSRGFGGCSGWYSSPFASMFTSEDSGLGCMADWSRRADRRSARADSAGP